MSYIIPPGFANLALKHRITGDPEEMVCNLGVDLSSFTGSGQDVANEAYGAWAEAMEASLPNTASFSGVTAYIGQDGSDPLVFESGGADVPGTSSGSSIPPNVAVIIRKSTELGGRAGRGRMFFPGVSEGLITPAGVLDGTLVDQIQGDIEDFVVNLGTLPSGELGPVLLHTSGSVIPPTPIVSFTVDTLVGSQRRRLR